MVSERGGWLGRTAPADHVTFNTNAAWMACHSLSATTPTKSFLTTTWTLPGRPATELLSTLTTVAPTTGGRTTFPCSMPGRRTFSTYSNSPVTLGGRSMRGSDVPSTVYWLGSFGTALLFNVRLNFLPLTNWP